MLRSGLRLKAILCRALGVFFLLVLGGCATTRVIDSEVRSFAGSTPPTQPASYRFERLLSQDLQVDEWTNEVVGVERTSDAQIVVRLTDAIAHFVNA